MLAFLKHGCNIPLPLGGNADLAGGAAIAFQVSCSTAKGRLRNFIW